MTDSLLRAAPANHDDAANRPAAVPFEITAMTAPAGIRLRGEADIATVPTLEAACRSPRHGSVGCPVFAGEPARTGTQTTQLELWRDSMTMAIKNLIPNYVAGTWDIDPAHSDVSFTVRHMMVSKVRGRFATFSGEIVTGDAVTDSSVTASIDPASVDTGNRQRDADLRSSRFFDVEENPLWTFRSTGVRADGNGFVVDGELTINGVTRAVPLALAVNGIGPDTAGGTRAGFSASTTIDRNDFGIDIKLPLDGGGVVVGDNIQISLEIEAVLRRA